MKRGAEASIAAVLLVVVGTVIEPRTVSVPVSAQSKPGAATQIPTFKVDPSWAKVPSKWVLGLVSGVNVDSRDRIWVLHRPRTVKPEDKARAAPAVLEFDAMFNVDERSLKW
jgi:hypothetical protein